MLDNIISLSDLLTRQKTYKVELIDEIRGATTKIGRFYENVANGNLTTEEDAATFLGYSGPKDKNYSNLKGRLYDRMLNSVFFLDQSGPNHDEIFDAGILCYRNSAIVRILLSNRKRAQAIHLAEKTYKISRKFDFTELNVTFSTVLASHYTLQNINKKKVLQLQIEREYYFKALQAETEIEIRYIEFNRRLSVSSLTFKKSEIAEISQQVEKLKSLQKTIKTARFNLHTFLYIANYYLEIREYKQIIDLMNRGLQFYRKKDIKSADAEYFLKTRGAIAYFMIKKYDESEKLFYSNLKIMTPSSINWFTTQKLLFSSKIIQEKYNQARDLLSKVTEQIQFRSTHNFLMQTFTINEAYIHFLVQLGKIDPAESSEKPLRKFRLNRFLNDVPTYSKDKRGVNISILIIQMILLVQNKKHGEIVDKLDALKMYSHRYLRSDNTFRSNCFIKMLAKLPDADYHPIRWERYVKKFRDRLDEHPFEISYHNLDIEVIPFETLYQLVVEMLYQQKGLEMSD